MFERAHHRQVAEVLAALNAPLLADNHCLFGGGTAIALRHGEYRESVDIDFLVSDVAGYRLQGLEGGGIGLRRLRTKQERGHDHSKSDDEPADEFHALPRVSLRFS